MKKSLLILALLCLSPLARGQDPTYPTSYSRGGNITTSSANCDPTACIGIGLPTPSASVITVGLTGTWSGTLSPEESQDGGRTFTSAGTGLTSNGTTSYVIAGFTSFRVRAGTLASGNAGVNFSVSNAPSGGVTSGTADPTGNACAANALYVQTTTGNLYSCDAGVFAKVGPSSGSGTVTSVSFTGGLISVATPTTTPALTVAGTSGGIPYFSSASTWASSAAGTVNTLMKWGGAGNPPIASSVTDNGTNVTAAEPIISTTEVDAGANGGAAGIFGLNGSTSGKWTLTANATATTATGNGNLSIGSNTLTAGVLNGTSQFQLFGKTVNTSTAPTIATGGCGGSGATISNAAGNSIFDINVGTGPTSAGCTLTFPSNTTGWVVSCNDQTTQSSTVFVQKQTGAVSQTSATIQTFTTAGVAGAPAASDVYHCTAMGH